MENAGPLGGVHEAQIHDDEIVGGAGQFENAEQGFERDGLALLGAQGRVQRAGEYLDARFVAGEEAGEQGFVEAVNAFERVEEGEAGVEIEHQADLAEGAGEFEERDTFRCKLRELHG